MVGGQELATRFSEQVYEGRQQGVTRVGGGEKGASSSGAKFRVTGGVQVGAILGLALNRKGRILLSLPLCKSKKIVINFVFLIFINTVFRIFCGNHFK